MVPRRQASQVFDRHNARVRGAGVMEVARSASISFYLQLVHPHAHRWPSHRTGTTALILYVVDRRLLRLFMSLYCACPSPQLRLGANPDSLKWYQEAELTNGRWAMAAVAGILFTDLVGLPKFWEAGAKVDLPFGGLVPLIAIEVAVFAVLEAFRYDGWKRTGKVCGADK